MAYQLVFLQRGQIVPLGTIGFVGVFYFSNYQKGKKKLKEQVWKEAKMYVYDIIIFDHQFSGDH